MSADDLCFLSALDLRDRYRRRDLSPVEVASAALDRIDRLNPSLNAFVTITPELAMEHARAAERAYAPGGEPGELAGIPISIKDLMPTKGIRTTYGSLLNPEYVPDFDPPFVERVYAAGAVMLGKTNTPENGWKGDSGNRLVGPTHNPWRHGHTSGGSSGGAGAAAAAGLGPLAQGSDGAGSIRIPSAFCGIFGLKPSFGVIPRFPASAMGDISHNGPMTRTVRDAALLLNVTAAGDARDRHSWTSGIDYLAALESTDVAGLRVAWSPNLGYAAVDPQVRAIASAAAARFADLGCHIEETSPGLEDPWEIIDVIWASGIGGAHHDNLDKVRDLLDPGRLAIAERGFLLTAADVGAAQIRRAAYCEAMRRFMDGYDLLLTPTLPCTAFPAGADQPGTVDGTPTEYLSWTAFTYPFNLTGQPAATVPCGFDALGLPVGLQIVGRWHDDVSVLRAAAAFEVIAPWAHLRPPVTG